VWERQAQIRTGRATGSFCDVGAREQHVRPGKETCADDFPGSGQDLRDRSHWIRAKSIDDRV
jgi:hypothetical protein